MDDSANLRVFIIMSIVGLFGIVTLALAAATLGTLNKRLNTIENKLLPLASLTTGATSQSTATTTNSPPQSSTATTTTGGSQSTTTTQPTQNLTLVTAMNITEILGYLNELQDIANGANGTRAINTPGFNRTLDYITDMLRNKTNFNVTRTFFSVRDFELAENPILTSSIDGVEKNYTYSSDPSKAEFLHVKYGTSSDWSVAYEVTIIPNGGCTEADWNSASTDTNGRIALIKRGGDCAFGDRATQAPKFNVSGILFYNDGNTSDRMSPLEVSLRQENALPALFLSYAAGQALADAVADTSKNVTVQLGINLKNLPDFSVGNICADTPSGNITETIIVGSHSDSVPAGPGINDNGSGSAANLGLAIALARLFQTSYYTEYKYRIRFCWWGAEEVGLLGAKDYVNKAKASNESGERIDDHLINLNFDMLGSPNYIFGIYDGRPTNTTNPTPTNIGNNKTTHLFINWFDQQRLPWTYTEFNGRSDYGPFLAEGIVAGGLFSGADGIKSETERDDYDDKLGQGLGGIAGVSHDPCYHKACDSIRNINKFAYETLVKAAAYALEYLAQQDNLRGWLSSSSNI